MEYSWATNTPSNRSPRVPVSYVVVGCSVVSTGTLNVVQIGLAFGALCPVESRFNDDILQWNSCKGRLGPTLSVSSERNSAMVL